ncbi:glycosyltransferase [Enterovirga rhinocerotis]|uniref:GT2 family glycosyltransferase n=1 Tax=Enterovirga rhinocerotis TaxID=1339210 RepID=A0A4V3DXM0_9HYPH|nr:glycosyltransferase [Enterovirga rhinocerotis]TDR89289.1 GT2 family glycosyltransferase [Enterovirga rhinocerotis]
MRDLLDRSGNLIQALRGEVARYRTRLLTSLEGHIDEIEITDAEIVVSGWIVDRRLGSAPDGAAVFEKGARLQDLTLLERGDLPVARFGRAALGFVARMPRQAVGRPERLTVGTARLPGALRASRKTRIGQPRSRGALDGIGPGGVSGWVDVDPRDAALGPELVIDGSASFPLAIDIDRPDVVRAGRSGQLGCGFYLPAENLADLFSPDRRSRFGLPSRHTFDLRLGPHLIDRKVVSTAISVDGRVERADRGVVEGWAGSKPVASEGVALEMLVDGVFFARANADRRREDLKALRASRAYRGFEFPLPLLSRRKPMTVVVRSAVSRQPVGAPMELPPRAEASRSAVVFDRIAAGDAETPVCVIVPIHNAVDQVADCLASVVAHSDLPGLRLLLLDDNSSDPAMGILLDAYGGRENVDLHRNPETLGFSDTVNRGVALAGEADVVILNSDTVVSPRWLQNLRAAAYSDRRIATATPMSDNAGAFSVPEPGRVNRLPAGVDRDAYARLLTQQSELVYPHVPTGHGFCLYVKRAAIRDVGTFDAASFPRGYGEETDFCMRATRAGWQHVIDDRTIVYHHGAASFGGDRLELNRNAQRLLAERYPEFEPLAVAAFERGAELATMRYVARRAHALCGRTDVPAPAKPRILFVLAAASGGTPLTNRDLMGEVLSTYDVWLLRSEPRAVELLHVGKDEIEVEARHVFTRPVELGTHRSDEYDREVGGWLLDHAIELIHIRHLCWHGLGLIDAARRLSIPIVLSFHDFYTVCPSIKLLDRMNRYCGGTCTAGDDDCSVELWSRQTAPPLKHRFVRRWREMMADALPKCDAFVTTSAGAAEVIADNFPAIGERGIQVIPHGRTFERFLPPGPAPRTGERIRILVPGNIGVAKGAREILALRDRDRDGIFEFHVLGVASEILKGERIIQHGRYEREEFDRRAKEIAPHFGAVLSIWPETYSHTLTELWAAGLPVLAFDFGAVAERIRTHGGGWLLPHPDADAMSARLVEIARSEMEYLARAEEVRHWQEGEGRANTVPQMAGRYLDLYDSVRGARLSFPPGSAAGDIAVRDGAGLRPRRSSEV